MSDVERPNGSFSPLPKRPSPNENGAHGGPAAGAGGGGEGQAPAARNMADIAKLFLDGARPAGSSNAAARRTPPNVAPAAPSPKPRQQPVTVQPALARANTSSPVLLALAAPARDGAQWRSLSAAAAGIALEQSTTVGLIGIINETQGRQLVLDVFGTESPEDLPAMGTLHGALDLQIARVLHTMRPSVGLWLVAAPEPESPAFAGIAGNVREWILVCPTDNVGLLATYQLLKRASSAAKLKRVENGTAAPNESMPAAFFITDEAPRAAVIHQRLRMAAQEFLKTDLRYAGCAPASIEPGERLLSMPLKDGDAFEPLWASIQDELCVGPGLTERELHARREMAEEPTPAHPARAPQPAPRPVLHSRSARVLPPAVVESTTPLDVEEALEEISRSAEEVSRTSAAAAGMMLDHLTQVLDPEERDALTAAFDDLPDSFETEVVVVAEPAPAAPAVPAPRGPVPVSIFPPTVPPPSPVKAAPLPRTVLESADLEQPVTLRAFDLIAREDRSRSAQWQAVERSIRDLVPDSVLLEARPPMSWAVDSCIAIDPAGRLHVWTLYKDGASWYALREWASEHRRLLGLTRRDVAGGKGAGGVCEDSPVVVHIVLPLEDLPAAVSSGAPQEGHIVNTILRTPARNIHLYRLRVLQWESRRGMVVVPIA